MDISSSIYHKIVSVFVSPLLMSLSKKVFVDSSIAFPFIFYFFMKNANVLLLYIVVINSGNKIKYANSDGF